MVRMHVIHLGVSVMQVKSSCYHAVHGVLHAGQTGVLMEALMAVAYPGYHCDVCDRQDINHTCASCCACRFLCPDHQDG
jgi:hypothetical protein